MKKKTRIKMDRQILLKVETNFIKKKQNTKYRTVGHDRLFGGVCFECLNRFLKNVSQSKSLGLD